ncbi:MAG TPA: hypothetical protein VFU86_02765 [Terriglobales bacterium]|nr:hypothetical protein [Terriglobales bacterium]
MIRPRTLRALVIAILALTCVSFAAQHRTTKKKKPAAPAAPPPPTLQSCGVSLRIPPGWELLRASEYEKLHPEAASDEASKTADETPETKPSDPAPAQQLSDPAAQSVPASQAEAPKPSSTESAPQSPAAAKPDNPCSFVIFSKYPSEIVRNTDADGPVGRMELEIVDVDLETAAAQLMEKDEKGWYVNGPNGTRYDARLNKPKRGLQTLTAVIVEACHDLNGKYRGLCESNRYVYSNGRRSALVSAGPYMGETEFSLLTSLRFAPISKIRPPK